MITLRTATVLGDFSLVLRGSEKGEKCPTQRGKFKSTVSHILNQRHSRHEVTMAACISPDEGSPYLYDRLELATPSIRLLTLQPVACRDAPLEGFLQPASLPLSRGNYDALSYCWGEALENEFLYINGKPLSIRTNLNDALRRLRRQDVSRNRWIDAVCIDQASDTEKTHQVRQMFGIYHNASKVAIWLGESSTELDHVILAMQEEFRSDTESKAERAMRLERSAKLFRLPWFNRMWVLQEVHAAQSDPIVLCGHHVLSWKRIAEDWLTVAWNDAGDEYRENLSLGWTPASALYSWPARQ